MKFMHFKVILSGCFLFLNQLVESQSLDSIVLRKIQWQIESFVELHSKDIKDSTTGNPSIVISLINWDSADCSMIQNIRGKDDFAKKIKFVSTNGWFWSPNAFGKEYFTDTIKVLRVIRNYENSYSYSIRFVYNYFVLSDIQNNWYDKYMDMNPCYPTIIVYTMW